MAPIDAAVTTASPTPSQIFPTVFSLSIIDFSFSISILGLHSSEKIFPKSLHFLVKFAFELSLGFSNFFSSSIISI
jgi:hypothetical protein